MNGTHRITLGRSMTSDEPSYHGIKLNFQPGTLNHADHASLSGGARDGTGEYVLTVPGKDDAQHTFKGHQTAAKDVDCLLIYDDESGEYRLERMDSLLRLDHQRNSSHVKHASSSQAYNSVKKTPNTSPEKSASRQAIQESPVKASSVKESARVLTEAKQTHQEARIEKKSTPQILPDEADEDEDDLDDLADMLESTLDESRSVKPDLQVPVITTASPTTNVTTRRASAGRLKLDESSEEEE